MKLNFLLQLRLWQKFALLGLVALALTAYPIYSLIKDAQGAINVVRLEQAGLPIIDSTLATVKALQDHRASSSYLVLGDAKRGELQPKHAAAVDEALSGLEAQVNQMTDVNADQRLVSIKRGWVALRTNIADRKIDQRRVTAEHIALIQTVLRLVEDITAWSTIDLDPDAGAYYIARATLIDLPQLSEAIGQLRSPVVARLEQIEIEKANAAKQGAGFNLEAALRDAYRTDDRANVGITVRDVEATAQRYDDNMRKAIAASPVLAATTAEQATQIRSATAAALQLVRKEILGKEVPDIGSGDYLKQMTVPREAVQKAATQTSLLVTALETRGANTRNTLIQVLIAELLVLLVGVGLATLIVRNITGTVAGLQDSVNRVRTGDTTALQAIESKDEVGDLGRTVNELLEERMVVQRKAEEENDGLNNSVVSLLGTMFELSQRNLSVRAEVTSDMVGTVADSVNMFADATATALSNVSTVANQVAESAGRVSSNSRTLSKQAVQDRQEVLEMTQEIGQASTLMQQVATLAEQSNQAAGQATATTLAALRSVNTTVGEMGGIRESIGEMEKRVKRLGERSQEISQIVTVINSISERTHVLALNASMQAAMAGEAGRGFAVVTEEVQRLADASRNATMQIAQLSQNIQLETSETVAALNRTVTDVVRGSEIAEKSGQQMQATETANARLVEAVQRIANESTRQIALAVRLGQRAQAITQSNEQADRLMKNTNDDVAVLVQSSDRLIGVVSEFKLA
jgi:twitching motility protein PilJ